MEELWTFLKEIIPIIVVIISSMFAFVIGKFSERNKKFNSMSDESVTKFLAKMYLEVMEITNVKNYDPESIKKFILSHVSNDEIYKLYDDKLLNDFYRLTIRLKSEEIPVGELSKEFYEISEVIEKNYWKRYKVSTDSFKWFISKKTLNPWLSLPASLALDIKKVLEYLAIISVMISSFVLADLIANTGEGIFNDDLRTLIWLLSGLIVVMYILFLFISIAIESTFVFKNKTNIKKNN